MIEIPISQPIRPKIIFSNGKRVDTTYSSYILKVKSVLKQMTSASFTIMDYNTE